MNKLNDADAPVPAPAPRSTLKLKSPVVRPAPQTPKPPEPQGRDPGTWADAYKRKMQADMDALASGMDKGTRRK